MNYTIGTVPPPRPERCERQSLVVAAWYGHGEDSEAETEWQNTCDQKPALPYGGEWLCWTHLEDAGFDTKALVD